MAIADFFWDAFWRVSPDRPQSGFAVHQIPRGAIDAFARRYGITDEDFEDLERVLRAVDAVFLEVMAEKLKQKPETKG